MLPLLPMLLLLRVLTLLTITYRPHSGLYAYVSGEESFFPAVLGNDGVLRGGSSLLHILLYGSSTNTLMGFGSIIIHKWS